ncbi:MAG TPA: protease HtpX [Myxococcota bacterium]|nr:protease HtpX [Myxococcota bacterium]
MKRVFLFLATNIAVLLVLSVVARLVGVNDPTQYGGLLAFAAVFGMGGALISLLISKWTAKMATGARVITEPRTQTEQFLVNTVTKLSQAAGIGMPEVAIFDSPQPNAFATGARRDAALVAVSSGLLESMKQDEIEGVLGHEITHVSNGDMVTLTLIQGVVNTFVIFASRVVGEIVDRAVFRNDRDSGRHGGGIGYFLTVIALQIVFGIAASLIVYAFSRGREFRADAGGARLAGRENMIAALERLKAREPQPLPQQLQAFGIAGDAVSRFGRLFMSHPPLDERIAALRAMTY